MKPLVLSLSVLLLTSCAAYRAQHAGSTAAPKAQSAPVSRESASAPVPASAPVIPQVLLTKQAQLISEVDRYRDELTENGLYDCCVKPACRQCMLTAGECHCRTVIAANGPCCGECTQAWVEGRGDAPGVDREKVLEHLGCVRELYEKKTPEGMTPPAQVKDNKSGATDEHKHH
jgi:hypothetical protein